MEADEESTTKEIFEWLYLILQEQFFLAADCKEVIEIIGMGQWLHQFDICFLLNEYGQKLGGQKTNITQTGE